MRTLSTLLTFLFFSCLLISVNPLLGQTPEGIHYQAVARDGNTLVANQTIEVQFTISDGGTAVYQETHSLNTNPYGLFSTVIGEGISTVGTFGLIDWASGNYNLKVELDAGNGLLNMGTTEFVSVPYSLMARKADMALEELNNVSIAASTPGTGDVLKWNGTAWVPGADNGSGTTTYSGGTGIDVTGTTIINTAPDQTVALTGTGATAITGTYPNFTISSTDNVDDADSDPSNEFQSLSLSGSNLTLSDGNTITLPAGTAYSGGTGIDILGSTITNTAPDQTVALTGAGATAISGTYPTFTVTSTDNVNDADSDPANELQSLSLSGSNLTLSNGNTISLPAGTAYSGGTGIDILGSTITNTAPDQTVALTGSGATGVTGTYPNFTISSTDNVNDADSDPANELQSLSLSGSNLTLSNGNTISLPAGTAYSGGTGIDILGSTITNTAPDQTVALTGAGATAISGSYPNFTVTSTDNVNDADSDPGNEFQSLSLSGNNLSLSDGNTISLPAAPTYSGGTGIDVVGTTITNTAPDQTVALTGSGATAISGVYPNFTIASTDNVDDADSDPANELQSLSLSGNNLSLSDGNTINLPAAPTYSGGTGIDVVGTTITNTAPDQTVALTGSGATAISGVYPNFTIASTDNVDDADSDPGNEFQSLSLSGNSLSLSDGNTISLPIAPTYSGGTGIDVVGTTITNTAPDQTVALTGSGATAISGTYPNFTITSTDNVDDADSDPANEFQSLSLSGNNLTLSDGNTVSLPAGTTYSGGTGIDITGGVVSNTGDTDGSDDINIGTLAAGDLGGSYPAPSVSGLQGNPVSTTNPANGEVLKWNGSSWAPASDNAGSSVWNTAGTDTYYNNGDVGIGTSSVDAKLEIYQNSSLSDPHILLHENGNDYSRLNFKNNNGTNYWSIAAYIASNHRNDRLNFWNGTGGDVMTITGDGEVGIGVGISPKVPFHVGNGRRVLFGIDTLGNGDKLMFLPDLHAFRVGTVATGAASTYWNRDSIGLYSFASGLNTRAQGFGATAMGRDTEATNSYAFASGFFSNADGQYSTAMGFNTDAFALGSTALGYSTDAEANYSFAAGYFAEAQAIYSIAIGNAVRAQSYASMAVGRYNVGGGNATSWISSDPIFEIGIGTGPSTRANAMTVRKNGNVGIGTTFPGARLHVANGELRIGSLEEFSDGGSFIIQVNAAFAPLTNGNRTLGNSSFRWSTVYATNGTINTSDRRDKQDIRDITYGLDDIMKLRPVSFSWKEQPETGTKLGLVAQDLQTVISEVVVDKDWVIDEETGERSEIEAERMGVYYSDLIPVLIKGMQEQQEMIESQQQRFETQQAMIETQQQRFEMQQELIKTQQSQIEELESRLSKVE